MKYPIFDEWASKNFKASNELNDLMQNYIEPLTKMIESNKEVKKIGGDISFNVGSANLNNNGKKEISKLIKSIKVDMADWNQYLEDQT